MAGIAPYARTALPKLKSGGMLLIDNADWANLLHVPEKLASPSAETQRADTGVHLKKAHSLATR
jgi:hypothetical protein|uniref:hypothetical protein n=1 Tax=Prosthecobacter sp. TaxID=1965333 RepID=UPI003784060E